MLSRYILIFLVTSICGCIYIPDTENDSRSSAKIGAIVEGTSTRKEVISIIGDPDFTALDGLIAVYDYSRITGHVIGLPLPIPGVGAINTSFYNPVEKLQSTQIEYDNDVVVSISSISDGYGCYENGICLDSGWTTLGGPKLVPGITALSTSRADDKDAKKFSLPLDGCSLYIYVVGGVRPEYPLFVEPAGEASSPLSLSNYLNLQIPRGDFPFQVFHSGTDYLMASEKEFLAEAMTTCTKPSVDFIEINYKLGAQGPNTRTATITLASKENGRSEILERRLLLSR